MQKYLVEVFIEDNRVSNRIVASIEDLIDEIVSLTKAGDKFTVRPVGDCIADYS